MLACCRFLLAGLSGLLYLSIYALVRVYQYSISPWLGPRCRYQPTCSQYLLLAIERYGPLSGLWRGLKRIGRCHPWSDSGWDPP